MSIQGILLVDLAGLILLLLILNLIRTRRLHIGYAAIWFVSVLGAMVMVSLPPILAALPALVGAEYPASALSLLAFIFIFLMLIFFSVQLSLLAARQTELIQALAINRLVEEEETGKPPETARD